MSDQEDVCVNCGGVKEWNGLCPNTLHPCFLGSLSSMLVRINPKSHLYDFSYKPILPTLVSLFLKHSFRCIALSHVLVSSWAARYLSGGLSSPPRLFSQFCEVKKKTIFLVLQYCTSIL